MELNNKSAFNPLIFTSAISAGLITLMPLFIFQFTLAHGQDLATREAIWKLTPTPLILFFYFLELVMVASAVLCLVLNKWFFFHWLRYLRTNKLACIFADHRQHHNIYVPLISVMVFFHAIGPTLHYFFPLQGPLLVPVMNGVATIWAIIFALVFCAQLFLWKNAQAAISNESPASQTSSPYGAFCSGMLSFTSAELTYIMPTESIAQLPATLTLIAGGVCVFFVLQELLLFVTSNLRTNGTNLRTRLMGPTILFLGMSLFRMGHFQVENYISNIGNFSYLIAGVTYGLVIFFFLLSTLFFPRSQQLPAVSAQDWVSLWPLISFVLIGCLVHKFLFSNIFFYSFLLYCLLCSILIFFEIAWQQLRFVRRQGIKFWAIE